MPVPVLDFWFDFASTYSYLAAMRIGPLAQKAEVRVRLRPFLLGPIFKAQGWSTSPFNLYPAKGRHMWRDLERSCNELRVPFRRPDPFPQNRRAQTDEAQRRGLFGAPSFTTADGELFWGNDRLEPALRWAKAPAARG